MYVEGKKRTKESREYEKTKKAAYQPKVGCYTSIV